MYRLNHLMVVPHYLGQFYSSGKFSYCGPHYHLPCFLNNPKEDFVQFHTVCHSDWTPASGSRRVKSSHLPTPGGRRIDNQPDFYILQPFRHVPPSKKLIHYNILYKGDCLNRFPSLTQALSSLLLCGWVRVLARATMHHKSTMIAYPPLIVWAASIVFIDIKSLRMNRVVVNNIVYVSLRL